MSKLDVSPLFDTVGKFVAVDELAAKTDKNTTDKKKFLLTFIPQRNLVNGRAVIDAAAAEPLGISIRTKVDADTWLKISPLLQGKIGHFFHLSLATESYSIDGSAGVWYRFYQLEPTK